MAAAVPEPLARAPCPWDVLILILILLAPGPW